MSAFYDLYENPIAPGSNKKPRLHARIVTKGTVGTDKLAEEIHERCTLTPGDIKAVLTSLSAIMIEKLEEGERIHIEGFGFLQMTVTCAPVKPGEKVRAESIRFKSVAFRPDKELKKALKNTHFERAKIKRHSATRTEADIKELLTTYFAANTYISREEFQHLCGFTKGTASRRIKELIVAGKLKKDGLYRFPVYVPKEGYFGK